MRRFLISLLLAFTMLPCLWAQDGLSVETFLDNLRKKGEHGKEVVVKNYNVGKNMMTLYRSCYLQLSDAESRELEACVRRDGASAIEKETGMKGGRLYYAFYRLSDVGKDKHRYLFYRNLALRSGEKPYVTIVYIDGTVTMADLRKRFGK